MSNQSATDQPAVNNRLQAFYKAMMSPGDL